MKLKIIKFLTIGLFFSVNSIAQNLPFITKSRPADFEYLSAPDSLGVRHELLMPKITDNNAKSTSASLPYPIIFIHGLNSNDQIWGDSNSNSNKMHNFLMSQNLSFGGRFDFNLNYDANNTKANKNIYPTTDADIAQFTSTLVAGDYYFVNFDTGIDGSTYPSYSSSVNVLSNQSAIAKQGKALQIVITKVMELTGRDKVILLGHSMGGLASREYLQNQSNWEEPYLNHHVAKIVTTGTPHGGSNTSASFLNALVAGIDNSSEAMRDLKTSYYYSPYAPGVFLFGGIENNSVMHDMLLYNFYNVDVNCNGVVAENIIGLNSESFSNNVDYSCIIGKLNSGSSDGVVSTNSADLSNFCPSSIFVNKFNYSASAVLEIHTDLPQQIYQNMQGLDEPNVLSLAYNIDTNKTYTGFTTVQATNSSSQADYDYYTFTIPSNSNVTLSINNIHTSSLLAEIQDTSGNSTGNSISNNNTNTINFSRILNAGTYYLLVTSLLPSPSDYLYPYTFGFTTNALSTSDFIDTNFVTAYPNPTSSKVYFDNTNFNFNEVTIFNYLGQEVAKNSFKSIINNQEIDMSNLACGVYLLKLKNTKTSITVKIVKE